MMALHGMAFARFGEEWRIVLCEDEQATDAIRDALAAWIAQSDKFKD
jgi:hypothetical protein